MPGLVDFKQVFQDLNENQIKPEDVLDESDDNSDSDLEKLAVKRKDTEKDQKQIELEEEKFLKEQRLSKRADSMAYPLKMESSSEEHSSPKKEEVKEAPVMKFEEGFSVKERPSPPKEF